MRQCLVFRELTSNRLIAAPVTIARGGATCYASHRLAAEHMWRGELGPAGRLQAERRQRRAELGLPTPLFGRQDVPRLLSSSEELNLSTT